MPCEFDWRGETVFKTFTGFVSSADFVGSAEEIAADPRFDDVKFIVNDFLLASGLGIDQAAYLQVAASRVGAARTNPNFRVLMIASSPMLDELREVVRPGVMHAPFDPWFCTTSEEAREWIRAQPVKSDFRATGF